MKLEYLICTSLAARPMDDATLQEIQARAVIKHTSMDVTGVLLYGGGRFMQYVEGPPVAIKELEVSIFEDSRHTDVEIRARGEVLERIFPIWSMGVLNLEVVCQGGVCRIDQTIARIESAPPEQMPDLLNDLYMAFQDTVSAASARFV